jgi:hypothetical protein
MLPYSGEEHNRLLDLSAHRAANTEPSAWSVDLPYSLCAVCQCLWQREKQNAQKQEYLTLFVHESSHPTFGVSREVPAAGTE